MQIDNLNKSARFIVQPTKGRVVVSLNPLVNLLIHTLNLYDLLGAHGRQYSLRVDNKASSAIDRKIHKHIAGKEGYFGQGNLSIYAPTMEKVLSERLYGVYPDQTGLLSMGPEPFNRALSKSWDEFYKAYWNTNFGRLLAAFEHMTSAFNWHQAMETIEHLTGQSWSEEMLVFVVEATAESGLTWDRNVIVGTLRKGGDAGFVHEGLHLILGERWANNASIQAWMKTRNFNDPFWGVNWNGKYEQAIIVALDSFIRGLETHQVERYFQGCQVGDLYSIVWPRLKEYVDSSDRDFEELMLTIIKSDAN